MNQVNPRFTHILIVLLTLAPTLRGQSQDQPGDKEMRQTLEKIAKIYDLASSRISEPVDPEHVFYDGAIRGVLSQLDPFSSFLDPDQFQSLQQQQRGVQKGFGAILNVQSGGVTVLQSIPGSPFGRAGIGPGDRIMRINGHRVASMDLQELVEVLQQAKSGEVHLSILQSGSAVPRILTSLRRSCPAPVWIRNF
jgi:carboxyl-terminal processing protease